MLLLPMLQLLMLLLLLLTRMPSMLLLTIMQPFETKKIARHSQQEQLPHHQK